MTKLQTQVREFHQVFEHPVNDMPTLLDSKTSELRIALIAEELSEYESAAEASDIVEIADALGDMLVVTLGAGVCHGLAIKSIPDSDAGGVLWYDILRADLREYEFGIESSDIVTIELGLRNLYSNIRKAAKHHRLSIEPIFDEIMRSNMSKLGEDGKPIYREDGKILKGPNYFPPDIAGELRKQGWVG